MSLSAPALMISMAWVMGSPYIFGVKTCGFQGGTINFDLSNIANCSSSLDFITQTPSFIASFSIHSATISSVI